MERARREVYEDEIKNLGNMCPLDYLSFLNSETKEKLLGLCLNRKLLESFDEEAETMVDEENLDGEIDEEMELEENEDF